MEDNEDVLLLIETALRDGGYDVVTALGGAEGLRKVEAERFDLVLTDLAMPDVSGVEVIAKLKKEPATWKIPVVAVTAYWTEHLSIAASAAGCDGFIAKPFSREELLYEVEKHLTFSRDRDV